MPRETYRSFYKLSRDKSRRLHVTEKSTLSFSFSWNKNWEWQGGSEEVEGKKEKKKEEKRGESEMIDHFRTIDTRKCTTTRNSHEARMERRCICKHCEKWSQLDRTDRNLVINLEKYYVNIKMKNGIFHLLRVHWTNSSLTV